MEFQCRPTVSAFCSGLMEEMYVRRVSRLAFVKQCAGGLRGCCWCEKANPDQKFLRKGKTPSRRRSSATPSPTMEQNFLQLAKVMFTCTLKEAKRVRFYSLATYPHCDGGSERQQLKARLALVRISESVWAEARGVLTRARSVWQISFVSHRRETMKRDAVRLV